MGDTPDYITYAESDPVPEEPAKELVRIVKENDPMKPWTLISRLDSDMDHEDIRVEILKPLVLEGVLTPTADGDIRVYEEERLESLI